MAGYTSRIVGSNDGSSAGLGIIGELQESVVTVAIGSAFTIGQFGNIGQISVTAGDWWVTGLVDYTFLATVTRIQMAISLFSANTTTDHVAGSNVLDIDIGTTGASHGHGIIANYTVNVAAVTTIFLKGFLAVAIGNQFLGRLSARRMR
jgi:hypothetical protein